MKKILMILVALMIMAVNANAQNVYVTSNESATAYHKTKTCSYLTKAKGVKSITMADAKKQKRHACKRCYPTAKKTTTAPLTKTAGKADKKATSNKATPARDEKGRFVKKAAQ